jgi:TRAP-type C4-dicarboxylate transport system permease small subunit
VGDLAATGRLIAAGWVLVRHDALAPREITPLLPAPARRVLALATDAVTLFYLGYVFWLSIEIIPVLGGQPSTAMRLPMAVPYGVIALGFGLSCLRIVLSRIPGGRAE